MTQPHPQRPQTDETLCFLCQKQSPTILCTRGKETFTLCASCAEVVREENNGRNRIKSSLYANDTATGTAARHIFQYTLGMDLMPTEIEFEEKEGK